MESIGILAHSPFTLGVSLSTAFKRVCQKGTRSGNRRPVWWKQTQQLTPTADWQMTRQESCITQGAGTALHGQANENRAHFGEHLGQGAEFVTEENRGDFNRQVWQVVVNIQNTSALLQHTRWETLLLSPPSLWAQEGLPIFGCFRSRQIRASRSSFWWSEREKEIRR